MREITKTVTDNKVTLECSDIAKEKVFIAISDGDVAIEEWIDRDKAQEFAYNILRSIQYGEL